MVNEIKANNPLRHPSLLENAVNSIDELSAINFIKQIIKAFSHSFPAAGFVIFWLIYRNTGNFQQAIISLLASSIPALINLILN